MAKKPKLKALKRALLLSGLSLLLCVSMLIGSTVAWFSDSVSSDSNVITAGNLDIVVDYTLDGSTWNDLDGANDLFQKGLWEPGHTEVVALRITNTGSLALKYTANMNITKEKIGKNYDEQPILLSNILTVETGVYAVTNEIDRTYKVNLSESTLQSAFKEAYGIAYPTKAAFRDSNILGLNQTLLPGQAQYVIIQVNMALDTANAANHNGVDIPTIDFGINVLAAQQNHEADSFGSDYDANAEYSLAEGVFVQLDGSLRVDSRQALGTVSKLASSDESIKQVSLDGYNIPVVRSNEELNEKLKEGNSTVVLAAGTYKADQTAGRQVTLVGTPETKVDLTDGDTKVTGAEITFEGLTIQSEPENLGYTNGLTHASKVVYNNCVINGTLGLQSTSEFNSCVFNVQGDYYNVWTWGAGTASFNSCTFNCDGKALLVYANTLDNGTSHQTVHINNCVFNDNGSIDGKAAIEITDTYPDKNITYAVIIEDTEVNGFSNTTQNATTYGGTDLGTNVWGNKNLLTDTDLNVEIDGKDVY